MHVEMEEIVVKISFLEILWFCEVLLSFSDTSSVELFCQMVFEIHACREEFWGREEVLHFNSFLEEERPEVTSAPFMGSAVCEILQRSVVFLFKDLRVSPSSLPFPP